MHFTGCWVWEVFFKLHFKSARDKRGCLLQAAVWITLLLYHSQQITAVVSSVCAAVYLELVPVKPLKQDKRVEEDKWSSVARGRLCLVPIYCSLGTELVTVIRAASVSLSLKISY